jgi:hypothetical protein
VVKIKRILTRELRVFFTKAPYRCFRTSERGNRCLIVIPQLSAQNKVLAAGQYRPVIHRGYPMHGAQHTSQVLCAVVQLPVLPFKPHYGNGYVMWTRPERNDVGEVGGGFMAYKLLRKVPLVKSITSLPSTFCGTNTYGLLMSR